MAERDRRRERRLRSLDDELRYCRDRAERYQRRIDGLERERSALAAEEEKAAGVGEPGAAGGLGGLADLVKSLKPETLQQIGEAVQGMDLSPLLGLIGGAGAAGAGAAAATGGAASAAGGSGGLLGLLGGAATGGGGGGSPLDGLSEVLSYAQANPLKGKRWSWKDLPGVLGLVRSPNVRALLATAGSVANVVRVGVKTAPQLSALLAGAAGAPAAAPVVATAVGEGAAASPAVTFRFTRPEGPPPVAEPWRAPRPWPVR